MKQPALGLIASILVIAISLGVIALIPVAKFLGSVTYALVCIIPMEIVIGITWGCKQPRFAAKRSQPLKGLLLAMLTAVAGVVVAGVYFLLFGSVRPLPPMIVMCIIVSVIVTFFAAIVWGGWPFHKWIKNPVTAGLTMLASCYIVNYIVFRLFFNYEFMAGAPVYVPSLDPHGMFNANLAMVFCLTSLSVMFLTLHFDLWPLTKSAPIMQQPLLGLVWTLICLVLGGVVFYLGIFGARRMDPLQFMVAVPIPFIFGTIVVLNMFQNSLFAKFTQPLRGVLNAVAAAAIGSALAFMYGALSSLLSGPLAAGAPGNDFERWLASALLAVTFPLLIFFAEFFEFWPLKKQTDTEVSVAG